MKTEVQTPMEVFGLPQHLEVPLFQRPYVWSEEEQWAPLWQDIRRLAELRLREPYSTAAHFLGAVVLQAHEIQHGHLPSSNIIDGQQRLTTLQILMDAAATVLDEAGLDVLAGQLAMLTHNPSHFVQSGETALKLRHSNRDRAPFRAVMEAEPPITYGIVSHAGSRVVHAHEFFATSFSQWLGGATDANFVLRADTLVSVLLRGLQLVVISLNSNENSQEIFETLNARGTPLTAADLIKNFVFQQLTLEGGDSRRAYADDWPFDTKFWETEVSVGRYLISRSSLFLNQWLISRTGEEIGPQSTFSRFKAYVEHESGHKMQELLPAVKAQALEYEHWTLAAADPDRQLSPIEMAVYRMHSSGVELLKPLLIWLRSPERELPDAVVNEVVEVAESWLIRRQVLRLTTADMGRIVADLIRIYSEAPSTELPGQVRSHLARLNVSSTGPATKRYVRRSLASPCIGASSVVDYGCSWRPSRISCVARPNNRRYHAAVTRSSTFFLKNGKRTGVSRGFKQNRSGPPAYIDSAISRY